MNTTKKCLTVLAVPIVGLGVAGSLLTTTAVPAVTGQSSVASAELPIVPHVVAVQQSPVVVHVVPAVIPTAPTTTPVVTIPAPARITPVAQVTQPPTTVPAAPVVAVAQATTPAAAAPVSTTQTPPNIVPPNECVLLERYYFTGNFATGGVWWFYIGYGGNCQTAVDLMTQMLNGSQVNFPGSALPAGVTI